MLNCLCFDVIKYCELFCLLFWSFPDNTLPRCFYFSQVSSHYISGFPYSNGVLVLCLKHQWCKLCVLLYGGVHLIVNLHAQSSSISYRKIAFSCMLTLSQYNYNQKNVQNKKKIFACPNQNLYIHVYYTRTEKHTTFL